ncbi:MAG: hypothetical protein ACREBR_01205 [bacterium]
MHNWWHHGRQQKQMGVSTSSEGGVCPLCKTAEETTDHIIRCHSAASKRARRTAWSTFESEMNKAKTAPLMTIAIKESIESWANGTANAEGWTTAHSDNNAVQVKSAVEAQSSIGWEHFLRGRIALKWKMAQQAYLQEIDAPRSFTAERWTKKLIRSAWNYSLTIWLSRNQEIYGRNEAEQFALRKETVIKEVMFLYEGDRARVSVEHRQLFAMPLDLRLLQTTNQLEQWTKTVKNAEQSEQRRRETEIRGTHDIRRYCTLR